MLKSNTIFIVAIFFFITLNVLFLFFPIRIDFTTDQRFSVSDATKNLIRKQIQDPVRIQLLLTGEMPAEFKKLSKSVSRILQSILFYDDKNLIQIEYLDIHKDIPDSSKKRFIDTLYYLGIRPSNIKARLKKGEGTINQTIFPAAIVRNSQNIIGVPFLSENLYNNVVSLNNAESLLEYKFAHAIEKISSSIVPILLYAVGHGEPFDFRVYDFLQTLSKEYAIDTVDLSSDRPILKPGNLLIIHKPTKPFSDIEKLKIDQFLMHGGNLMFCINKTKANMSLLANPKGQIVKMNNANLDDLLFHYGIRIKNNLVQDLNCDQIPVQVGWNGNKPQYKLLPWYFFPLLNPNDKHPITKNIDIVLSKFSSSIEIIKKDSIENEKLLFTSNTSRKQSVPSLISLEALKLQPDVFIFKDTAQTIALLNKGKFSSPFKNILTETKKKLIEKKWGFKLNYHSKHFAKVLVVSDGDMFINSKTSKDQPTEMGSNMYTKYVFGNKIFLTNSIEYLTSNSNILEARKKSFILRALDNTKIEKEKTYWQYFNILVPILILGLMILLINIIRYRKYHLLMKK